MKSFKKLKLLALPLILAGSALYSCSCHKYGEEYTSENMPTEGSVNQQVVNPTPTGESEIPIGDGIVRHIIKWFNHDGSLLFEEVVIDGEMPVYRQTTPLKDSENENSYCYFMGWDKYIEPATKDEIYTAIFVEKEFTNDKLAFTLVENTQEEDEEEVSNYYIVKAANADITGEVVIPTTYNDLPVKIIEEDAFRDVVGVTNVYIPNCVEQIGSSAFKGCSGLESICIPTSVKTIGDYAFSGLTTLNKVVMSNGIAVIGTQAFKGCNKVANDFYFPITIESIGEEAFESFGEEHFGIYSGSLLDNLPKNSFANSKLKYANLSNCLNYSEQGYALQNAKELEKVILSDELIELPMFTFYHCEKLDNVVLPESLETMGAGLFEGCLSLTDITIPSKVTILPDRVFYSCTSLNVVECLGYVSKIGVFSFASSAVTKIELKHKNSLISIGSNAFSATTRLDNYEIAPLVSSISSSTFAGAKGLTSISLPDNVTEIGNYAFQNAKNLKLANLNKVTSVGDNAFMESGLEQITIPSSLTSISNYCFAACNSLEKAVIQEGVTKIGNYAFSYCENLSNLTLPSSLETVGEEAFSHNTGLKELYIRHVTTIQTNAFYKTGLEQLTLGGGVNVVPLGGFADNAKLKTITLESGVTRINRIAFRYSESLQTVNLPVTITAIEDDAFAGCFSDRTSTNASEAIGFTINYAGTLEQWNQIEKNDDATETGVSWRGIGLNRKRGGKRVTNITVNCLGDNQTIVV